MKLPLFNGYGGEPYKGLPEDRFKFLKHELVEGVGLYDLEARLYDPTLGRFAQIDPLPDDGGQESLTPYKYAWNNPPRFSDPDGRCPFCPAIPFLPEIFAGAAAAGEIIAGSAVGLTVGAVIGKNIDKIKNGLDRLAKAGMPGGEHQYANWARGLDPNKSSVSTSSSGGGGKGRGSANNSGTNNKPKVDKNDKDKVEVAPNKLDDIPKPGKGKGSVTPDKRDPQRIYTEKQKQEMLDKQDGKCLGCEKPITAKESKGHHVERHADGGPTTIENGAALCEDCHKQIHKQK